MMPATELSELARVLSQVGNLLPDLFAIFDGEKLSLVAINTAGKKLLDPSGVRLTDRLVLTDLVGINEIDRFNREVYPQTRVLGSWHGVLVLRNLDGSEFTSQVKLLGIPPANPQGGRCLCLHASRSATGGAGSGLVSDQDMLGALMETSPNYIYFKDEAGRYLRISRTKAKQHGLTDPREAIGKTDFDYFSADHASPAFEDEQRILKTGEPIIDLEEKETYGDGKFTWASTSKFPFHSREGKLIGTYGVSRDITARKIAEEKLRTLSRAVEQSPTSIVITDTQGRIEYVNPYFEKITGYAAAEVIGQNPRVLKSGRHPPEFYQGMWADISAGGDWNGEFHNIRKNGELYWEHASISAIRNEQGQITHYVAVKEDITERKRAEANRLELQSRLQLSSKLESVGSLAAGVAHEINTPTQYIADNVRFLMDSVKQLFQVIASYRAHFAAHPECAPMRQAILAAEKENDLEYLLTEIPRTLEQSLEGLGRISKIVGSLKEFSHPGGEEKSHADLNRAIETTIAVSRHEWKYVADVVTELDPNLPPVHCVIDEINQAVLNLVVNAAHAVEDALKKRGEKRGCITLRTRREAGNAIIEVQDTGTGIPEGIRGRIFEPFYTTKGVGKGTGQGLAIAQAVIVKKHRGSLEFTTEMGKGTTFRISLPLESRTMPTPEAAPQSAAG